MTEVLFYHLERRSLEQTLPGLLKRCLQRGWRSTVEVGSEERLQGLNDLLWVVDDEEFLPHGTSADGNSAHQPIYLTLNDDNPNQGTVRFYVDRAEPKPVSDYERVVVVFDGNDPEALAEARIWWANAKAAENDVQYWRQNDSGQWVNQA